MRALWSMAVYRNAAGFSDACASRDLYTASLGAHLQGISEMTDSDLMIPGPDGQLSVRTRSVKESSGNVVILVQGANVSGQAGFDFKFDGGQDYSFMDGLAQRGVGSVTFSIRGYEKSELNSNPLSVQTDQAIEDLGAVVDWLHAQGIKTPHILGWSWGGRIAGRYAEAHADKIDRVILLDPALGGGQLVLPAPSEEYWDNTYDYFFNRLEEEFTELAARKAFAEIVSSTEPKSPNGIRQENAEGSIPVKPADITRPTMLIYGDAAGAANYMHGSQRRGDFFESLGTEDKALVVIPGGGDYAHIQNPRRRFHKCIADFLTPA
jgi:pimeloyl-ACP methyl ester carboxylesterase